jgi:membrane carboxypeptidase/penicillin-binding protein
VDAGGKVLEAHQPASVQAFDPLSVALVTQMLQAVLTEGTGAASKAMGLTFPAAGKTGTSENFQDAWFVGYMPNLACGVWVGYDKPKSLGRAAAGVALPLWVPFMQRALTVQGSEEFPEEKGFVRKTIDPETGLLVRSGCPIRRSVDFLAGTEPTAECPLHAGGVAGFFHRLLTPKVIPVKVEH